jgi:hypothetical protein
MTFSIVDSLTPMQYKQVTCEGNPNEAFSYGL